ncbi:GGDEF domain-containing protein [Comamonas jiangduensis]|uniref:GGDEF domain-containing protein n=1 Tax=Comamonas jiangduensis TaxID=1194168 RepID=UPI0028B1360E|nr:GGDEF domain-containing protein [Comamonas jiangduensis]
MHILQNLVQMTGQRDHLRLELSVLSTFMQLPGVTNVRALELVEMDSGHWVRARTWLQDGQLVSSTQDVVSDTKRLPLRDMLHLHTCITQQKQHLQHSARADQHVIWLPVWMHEKARVCLEVTQSEPFTPHSLDVITGIFSVYQNYQSLLDYSERDALTGLLNRKTFDEHLLRFATAAQADHIDEMPWLAVIDIDHFKLVNDRFGHLFGDEVLILVANLLRSAFSAQHRIFRFGGEEFVVLMPAAHKAKAHASLEAFRAMVASHNFPQIGRVTVSVGFAGAKLCSPVEILGQADQALYYAKENGRNQVCHFEQLQDQGLLHNAQVSHDDVELF